MTSTTQALSLAKAASPLLTGADALTVIKDVVGAVGEWVEIVEQEKTKRAEIAAHEAVALAAIATDREILLTYLDRSFDERKENFEKLFTALDDAMRNDRAAVADLLGAITALAVKSPFADLTDAPSVVARLNDKGSEWTV